MTRIAHSVLLVLALTAPFLPVRAASQTLNPPLHAGHETDVPPDLVREVREAHAMGLVDGITTNPSLIAKSGRKYKDVVVEMCEIVNGPISAEVLGVDYDGMMAEAREWHKVHKNIVVKLPLIPDGLKAVRTCAQEGIRTNVTLCFSANQALFAALAGAYIISPFVGRLDDISEDGLRLVHEIVEGEGRSRNVVIEFESFEAARIYFFSPEYTEARRIRWPVSLGNFVIVEGV